jgi:hypothetical protein
MTCERCYQPLDQGEHGLGLCPLEPRGRAPVVWVDDIPGGLDIVNALCHADGSPRRFYSKSAIKAACEVKGVIPYHEVYAEGGETRIKDAWVHDDWLRSSDAQRARQERDERRRERRA